MSNTIKFLHVPGSPATGSLVSLFRKTAGIDTESYGGYSVGYRVLTQTIELSFAFCMDDGDDKRDVFNKKEARSLIRHRFEEGDFINLTAKTLAPRCFTAPVPMDSLTPQMIETLVRTFARENLTRLRHHARTGFVNFEPVVDVYGPRNPTKSEREAARAARAESHAQRHAAWEQSQAASKA